METESLLAGATPPPPFDREEIALGDGRRLLLFSLVPGPAPAAPEAPPTPTIERPGT